MGAQEDEKWMRQAITLAARGGGATSPNPMVGAVIVRDGRAIGQGWHRRCGGPHAEVEALADCARSGQDVRGATAYVTLEPCCHTGRQGPCTRALIDAGIARVVAGCTDPNPDVARQGLAELRRAGVVVTDGVLEQECREAAAAYFHARVTGRPLVLYKFAATLDGKTACSRPGWITGARAREHVHHTRAGFPAIMVGAGTVLADDPQLTCRIPGGESPTRIVCDSRLTIPLSAQVVRTARQVPTVIATCVRDRRAHQGHLDAGCEVITVPAREGRVDLEVLLRALYQRGVNGVVLEGGGQLAWSAARAGLIDRVHAYPAPVLLGGEDAPTALAGAGFATAAEGVRLHVEQVSHLGEDLLVEARVIRSPEGPAAEEFTAENPTAEVPAHV